jgi:hypothetical protein
VNPEHALQLATAAIELHVKDDPDIGTTAQTVEVVGQSLRQAKVSSFSVPSPQEAGFPERSIVIDASRTPALSGSSSRSEVALHSNGDLMPIFLGGAHQDDTSAPDASSEMRQSVDVDSKTVQERPRAAVSWTPTPWSVLLLIAVGVAFVAIGVGRSRPAVDNTTKESTNSGTVAEVRRQLSSPGSNVATEVPRSISTPSAGRKTTTLPKSQPARVTVTAQTLRSRPAALPNGRVRFDATLRAGIDLYKRGWFGPAAGRFKEAVAIDPRSG